MPYPRTGWQILDVPDSTDIINMYLIVVRKFKEGIRFIVHFIIEVRSVICKRTKRQNNSLVKAWLSMSGSIYVVQLHVHKFNALVLPNFWSMPINIGL